MHVSMAKMHEFRHVCISICMAVYYEHASKTVLDYALLHSYLIIIIFLVE